MEQNESIGIGVVEEAGVNEEELEPTLVVSSLCINVSESMVTDTLMV